MGIRVTKPRADVAMEPLLRLDYEPGSYYPSPGRVWTDPCLDELLHSLFFFERRGFRPRVVIPGVPAHLKPGDIESRDRAQQSGDWSRIQGIAYWTKNPSTVANLCYVLSAWRDSVASTDPALLRYITFLSCDWGTWNQLNRIVRVCRTHSDPRVRELFRNLFLVLEFWHIIYALLKQIFLAGNKDDASFLHDELWLPFFFFC